ncbi:MAG: YggT family protein [Rhabdochlamydiaceae bacterium]
MLSFHTYRIMASIINHLFNLYNIFLMIRIVSSWFPQANRYKIINFISYYTDPYLNLFRRFIPPLGGVIDFSPMIAYFFLKFLESIILKILTWL